MTNGPNRISLFRLAVVVVLFIAATAFLAILITSGDPAWFVRGFSERPLRVVVYQSGAQRSYQAGDPGYETLAGAVQASLDQGVARPSAIGLSEQSLQDAFQKYLTVEAVFAGEVKLHASFNTYRPTRMLFLITGRHSELPLVFMGVNDRYMTNAPVLHTIAPLRAALSDLGYSLAPAE